jgi:uncharacterized protein YndB with AHSA1/START domain
MSGTEQGRVGTATSVLRTIDVACSAEHAFGVFTEKQGTWWPLASHHIANKPAETVLIEPRAGGRWFERAADGSECDWGRVLAWEPPHRLLLAWQLTAEWKYDPGFVTEVEVRFVRLGPELTRVELEHRDLERFGPKAEEIRRGVGSDNGWPLMLRAFAAVAAPDATAR